MTRCNLCLIEKQIRYLKTMAIIAIHKSEKTQKARIVKEVFTYFGHGMRADIGIGNDMMLG